MVYYRYKFERSIIFRSGDNIKLEQYTNIWNRDKDSYEWVWCYYISENFKGATDSYNLISLKDLKVISESDVFLHILNNKHKF